MTNTRQAKANKGNRIAFGILIIIVSLFCFLSVVGALGGVSQMVYSFLAGFFGLATYAYSIVGIILGVALTFGIKVKMRFSKIVLLVVLFSLGILALQIYTSSAHIIGASCSEYLLACYNNTNTAGGMLYGILAFLMMKSITTVGALVVACVAFFALALFMLIPTFKCNVVTYSASSKKEREGGGKKLGKRVSFGKLKSKKTSQQAHPLDSIDTPTLVDFSQGGKIYSLDIAPSYTEKKSKKLRGAGGYKPLGSYDPLFPNANGGYEDEVKINPEDKFSARGAAKAVLFGQNPTDEDITIYKTLSNPRGALSSVSAPSAAAKRGELRTRLGVDATTSSIRADFMARYRADSAVSSFEEAEIQPQYQEQTQPDVEKIEFLPSEVVAPIEQKETDFSNFEALKAQQTRLFGEMYSTQRDEKKEVVKPTKITPASEVTQTVKAAQDAVNAQVNVGMQGVFNRTMSGEEEKKTTPPQEIVSQGYAQEKKIEQEPQKPASQQSVQKPTQNIVDLDRGGYKPQQEGARLPRAFEATAVTKSADMERHAESTTKSADGYSVGDMKRPSYEMSKPSLQSAPRYHEGKNAVDSGAPTPPAPIKQEVTGDFMSRTAIQSATDIAKQSARNVEMEEAKARISNIKQALRETPEIGDYERKSLLAQEKVAAANERGIQKQTASSKKTTEKLAKQLENIDTSKERVSQVSMEQAIQQATQRRPYSAPPISLLDPPAKAVEQDEDYETKKEGIITVLQSFGIDSKVIEIKVGPTFTMYKLRVTMPKGRSISQILSYQDDIAMAMQVESVRVYIIPRESAVAIEAPNKIRANVNLSEIINSAEFNQAKSVATFALGKNLHGTCRVMDVAKLPHALVAGATGAGKSCCINSIIVSLLFKASPDELRFIMIDPKRVELSMYKGIPHLLMDEIIFDADKAIRALNWAISEMERRIKYLSETGFRDIDEYNADCGKHGYEKMPRIVIIVDEFADLMSTGKKAVEDTINRIARLARAVGIHLILATQRPSVDVISGTIKNNLPTRIAFRVTSIADSRTVLDLMGAEKLLGYGDMLLKTQTSSELERMQGAFISNAEIKRVIDYVKKNNDCYFDNNVKDAIFKDKEEEQAKGAEGGSKRGGNDGGIGDDVLAAIQLGIDMNSDDKPNNRQGFSISNIQRKLGYGWPRASKIYDKIDEMGLLSVDPADPKKRIINITQEELNELAAGNQGDDEE